MAESHFLFKVGNFVAPRGAIRSGPETHSANRKCLNILIPAFREFGAVGSMCIPNCACRRRQTFCVRIIDLVGTSLGASVVLHWLQPPSPPISISNASEDIGPLFMTTEIYTCATRLSARVAQRMDLLCNSHLVCQLSRFWPPLVRPIFPTISTQFRRESFAVWLPR